MRLFLKRALLGGFLAVAALMAPGLRAEPVCVDGVCYPSAEAAREAGVVLPSAPTSAAADRRLALGYMNVPEFTAFLKNEAPVGGGLEDHALGVVLLLVLLGGLAANLTPCVLPLVPINLILIGKGWRRGAAYAAGITTTYGALGLAAAFGGLAFGSLQASPWFNAGVALVFILLACAMCDVLSLPNLIQKLKGLKPAKGPVGGGAARPTSGLKGPYFLGLGAATLASACVEPILIATLLLTAKWFAAGRIWAVILPFVLGAGMGLPYPFAAAGFSVLPKPGAWMVWVKRAFALVFVGMAAWYGLQAAQAWRPSDAAQESASTSTAIRQDQPTLIILGAPWCRNCKAMERSTLKEAAVLKELANFNVRRIEINDFGELARYPELSGLDIKGVPAYVILNEIPKEIKK